jgi:hypothetical protein
MKKRIINKNVSISASIKSEQYDFLQNNPNFSVSKFLQLMLDEYIERRNKFKIMN